MSDAANVFNSPAPTTGYGYQLLESAAIVPSLTNPRKHFDQAALEELAATIKGLGLAEPLLVRPLPGSRLQDTWTDRRAGDPAPTHEIVAGERRWRACAIAGVKQIPAIVRDLTDSQVLHLQVIENLQRQDLHPLEEADGYRKILDVPEDAGKPMRERMAALAKEIGKSPRYVYQTLQLQKLADFPRQMFLEGKLQYTIAVDIASIGNEAQQIEACRRVAGLGPKGTDVVEHPMSYRAAAEYIRNNFRLLLSKAPFPIKVEFAGVAACTTCEKMSANARELFDEGTKVADTCLDPRCYGKKNTAHHEQVAQAAKAKGARVITGKEAKKLLPYEHNPASLTYQSEYESLDEKRWDVAGKEAGKTVQQLLGDDMPLPVLIQRQDGQGFVQALPKKDITRLLKERGLIKEPKSTDQKNPHTEAERKARMVKEQRWAVAEALLQALDAVPANEPHALNLDDQNGLRAHLMLPMVGLMHYALDHECRKRLNKLLGVDEKTLPLHPHSELVTKYLQRLDGIGVNRFIVGCLIAGELYVGPYSSSQTERMDEICALLKVDAKKIISEVAARQKQESKVKKAGPTKKTAAAKAPVRAAAPAQAFMEALTLSPALEAVVGDGPMPRVEVVQRLWAYVKTHKLQDQQNKRMLNADEKLKAVFGKDQVSMFEMAGLIAAHVGANAGKANAPAVPKVTPKSGADKGDETPAVASAFKVGDRVRFKQGLKGHAGILRKVCGREGTVSVVRATSVMVKTGTKGEGKGTVAKLDELELVKAAASHAPAWPFPTTSAKAEKTTAKKATKNASDDDALAGEITLSTGVKLSPQPAWPFPKAMPKPLGDQA
jgi:ParB/RepB/Spo0J family partition protein